MLFAPRALDMMRLRRVIAGWAGVFAALVFAFVVNYTVLPSIDHRYRAAFFPGERLATELTQRFRAATGVPLSYVIGSMWDGGNVAHYSPDQPEVLIDGLPHRSPWIDLDNLQTKGALLVWTVGDPHHMPPQFAAIAASAKVGESFTLPARRGKPGEVHVGWAILAPRR